MMSLIALSLTPHSNTRPGRYRPLTCQPTPEVAVERRTVCYAHLPRGSLSSTRLVCCLLER